MEGENDNGKPATKVHCRSRGRFIRGETEGRMTMGSRRPKCTVSLGGEKRSALKMGKRLLASLQARNQSSFGAC